MRPSSHRMSWPARLGLCVVLIALLSAFLPASPFSPSVPHRARAATRAAVTLFPPETLYANGASLNWTKYSGPPQFDRYEVHRSPTPGFTPSQTTLIATLGDVSQTTYRDTTAAPAQNFTYKIAVAGTASSEQTVTLPAAGTATKTIQPDPASGQNTYVENLTGVSACFNFGAKPSMLVGSDATNVYRGLLSFDLRDIPGSATVNSATLSLRHDAITTGGTVNVYPATRGWNEGSGLGSCTGNGATWSEATGGIAWTAAGGDYTTARVASVTHTSGQGAGWDNLDVRLHVQDWVSGVRPNRGLLLRHANESLGSGKTATYKSDDFTTTTTYRPKLTVTYTDDSASASPAVCMASLPSSGAVLSGTVTITASAADDRRVDRVDFMVDTTSIGTDTSEPYQVTWNSASVPNGTHTIKARATDDVGNSSTATSTVTVDNTGTPSTAITSPAPNATVGGTLTITATATDDAGIAKVDFEVDGDLLATDPSAPYSTSWDTLDPVLPAYDGWHNLSSRAYDTSGHVVDSSPVAVQVANATGTTYQATMTSTQLPVFLTYDPGAQTQQAASVTATYTNAGSAPWDARTITAYYRWYAPDGTVTTGPGVVLDAVISPDWGHQIQTGASVEVPFSVQPPTVPVGSARSTYKLRFDLQDNATGTWFSSRGSKPVEGQVRVKKKGEADRLGLERSFQYEGQDIGAGMTHLVNVATGNSILHWVPFSSAGRGLGTVLGLTYNSLEDDKSSRAGANWSMSISSLTPLSEPLDYNPNWIEFSDGDGTVHHFDDSDHDRVYQEPAGVNLYGRRYSDTDPDRAYAFTRPDRVTFFYAERQPPTQEIYPSFVRDGNLNELKFKIVPVPGDEDPGKGKYRIADVTDAAGIDPSQDPERTFHISYYSKDDTNDPQIRGQIKDVTDHEGHIIHFNYYADGNLLRLTQRGGTDANGCYLADRSFVLTYTREGSTEPAIPAWDDRKNPDPQTPNQSDKLFGVFDPRVNETTFSYITSGQDKWKILTRTDRPGANFPASPGTSYAYPSATQTTVTDQLTFATTYTYDTGGQVTTIAPPQGPPWLLEWSPDLAVTEVTEPGGAMTTFSYNPNGYITQRDVQIDTGPTFNHTVLTYQDLRAGVDDPLGSRDPGTHLSQLATKTDPNGYATPDPDDYKWSFTYDSAGNLRTLTDPEGRPTGKSTVYDYYLNGDLKTITDTNLRQIAYFVTYDDNGLPTSVQDAKGQSTVFQYDDDGLLRSMQDPLHANDTGSNPREYRSFYDYDSFHRLTRQSTPKSTKYERGILVWSDALLDPNDNLLTVIEPHYGPQDTRSGPSTSYEYDVMDRRTLVTGPDRTSGVEQTKYDYDGAGRLFRVTLPKGVLTPGPDDYTTTYGFDALDQITSEARYDAATGTTLTAWFCYTAARDPRWRVSPRAGITSDPCGLPSPPNYTRTFDWYPDHKLKAATDALGHVRRYTYDENRNLKTLQNENGDLQTREYDQRNLLTKLIDPFDTGRAVTTMWEYDAVGHVTRKISPRAWDTAGGHAPFNQYVTMYNYDELYRVTRVDLPTSTVKPEFQTPYYVHNAYDPNGNVLWTSVPVANSDPAGVGDDKKTQMTYFDPGWVRTTDDPANPAVHFDYTAQGWQRTRTPEQKNNPGTLDQAQTITWTHYPDGLLKERKDQEGNSSTYTYDPDNNLTNALDASGAGQGEDPTEVQATYDGLDRELKVRHRQKQADTTPFSFTTYVYDGNDNVVERDDDGEETPGGSQTKAPTKHEFNYDQADYLDVQFDSRDQSDCSKRKKVDFAFADTGWESQRIIYRGSGSPGSCTWTKKQTTNWTYFANGKLKVLSTLTTSGGTDTEIERHTVSYLDTTVDPNGDYVNGNRTVDTYFKTGPNPNCTNPAAPCTAQYFYDPRDRVYKTINHGVTTDYTVDPSGNVTQEVEGGTTRTFAYTGNQLQSVSVNGQVASRYWYDPHGNVDCVTTAPGSQSNCSPPEGGGVSPNLIADYAYDGLDRLASYRSYSAGAKTDTAAYTYDALDRVLKEVENHSGAAKTTDFNFLGLTNQVTQEDKSDASGTETKTYTYDAYGHRIGMTDDPADPTKPVKTYTYGYDVHGSVSLLLDEATSSAVAAYGYKPYGARDDQLSGGQDTSTTNPLNPFRYGGKRYDSGTATASTPGGYDMGARRFGPDVMRFAQPDLFQGALADLTLTVDPLTQNRYALAGGNPLSYIEWDGHVLLVDGSGGAATSANPASSSPSSTPLPSAQEPPAYIGPLSPEARRALAERAARQRRQEAFEDALAASFGALNKVHGAYMGGRSYVTGLSQEFRYGETAAIRTAAGSQLVEGGRLTGLARSPVFKGAGWVATGVSAWLTFDDYKDQGKSTEEALARTTLETAGGWAGGAAVGAACAAAGVASLGVGLVACGVGAVLAGTIGSQIGKFVGDTLFGEGIKDAAGDFVEGLAGAADSAFDFFNPFD